MRHLSLLSSVVAFAVACGSAPSGSAQSTPIAQSGAQSVGIVAAQHATPQARCEAVQSGPLAGDSVQLVAVFESTALEIAVWQESGRVPGGGRAGSGQSPLRSYPQNESIASCYFDGTFTFRWPLPQGATPPVFERMLILVDGAGQIISESGGTKSLYPLVRPAAY